jgi:hypothetical protein
VRPDAAQAALLDRLGLDLPQRLRVPPPIARPRVLRLFAGAETTTDLELRKLKPTPDELPAPAPATLRRP